MGEDFVGRITLRFSGESSLPTLVFTGPQFPADGINPQMELSYDATARRVRIKAGLTTDDDSFLVDLTDLPEELRRLIAPGASAGRPVNLNTPRCDALWDGQRFMSYEEYNAWRRASATVLSNINRSRGIQPGSILDASAAVSNVLYPPLTRTVYNRLVSYCRGRRMMALPSVR